MASQVPAGRLVAIGEARGGAAAGAREVCLGPGPLGVALVIEGVPMGDLPPGTRLQIGDAVIVELLPGDPPASAGEPGGLAEASPGSPRVPGRVLSPGTVRPGDAVAIDTVLLPLEDALDLHPFRPDEIAEVVREYLAHAQAAGLGEVRVIHGRGHGVQREIVRRLLAALPSVAGFADAPPERGGWGATVVRLQPASGPPPT